MCCIRSHMPSSLTYFREPWQNACPFFTIGKDDGQYFVDLGRSTDINVADIDPGKNRSSLVDDIFSAIKVPPPLHCTHFPQYFSKSQLLTSPSEISRCPRRSPTAFQDDPNLRAISRPRLTDVVHENIIFSHS